MGKYIRFFQKKPKIVSLVVILLGVVLAFGIAKKPHSPSVSDLLEASLGEESSTYDDLLQRYFSVPGRDLALFENTTDKLLQEYQEEVFRLNEDKVGQGVEVLPSLTLPDDAFIESLFEKEVGGSLSIPLFSAEDVRVSTTSSEEALQAYAQSYGQISERHLNNLDISFLEAAYEVVQFSDSSSMRDHVSVASAHVRDLLELETPESLLPLHLELLNVWQGRHVIGNAFLQSKDDPVKGVLALNTLPQALGRERDLVFLFEVFSEGNGLLDL